MPINRPVSREWFARAAEQGNEMAIRYLEVLNFNQPAPVQSAPQDAGE